MAVIRPLDNARPGRARLPPRVQTDPICNRRKKIDARQEWRWMPLLQPCPASPVPIAAERPARSARTSAQVSLRPGAASDSHPSWRAAAMTVSRRYRLGSVARRSPPPSG